MVQGKIGRRYGTVVITRAVKGPKRNLYEWKCDCGKVGSCVPEKLFGGPCRSHRKIFPGRKFGHLTATGRYTNGKVWCKCACGKEKYIRADKLLESRIRSCGHCYQGRKLIGQQIGRLKIIRGWGGKRKPSHFLCRCVCGNLHTVRRDKLLNHTAPWDLSCGCARYEYIAAQPKKPVPRWCDRSYRLNGKYLYIIEEEGGNFKVGVSNNPERRLRLLQTGNPRKLDLISVFDNEPGLERLIHIVLDHRNLNGEWFRPHP